VKTPKGISDTCDMELKYTVARLWQEWQLRQYTMGLQSLSTFSKLNKKSRASLLGCKPLRRCL